MILLLGASGYVGQAFECELKNRCWPFTPLSRKQLDYSRFDLLLYTEPWVSRMESLADLYECRVRDDELHIAAVCKVSRSFGNVKTLPAPDRS